MTKSFKIAKNIQDLYNEKRLAENNLDAFINSGLSDDDCEMYGILYDIYFAATDKLAKALMDFCKIDRQAANAMMASEKFANLMSKTIV